MSEPCYFCSGPVNPHDEGTYKQVVGWVHGKKRDSMTLREDTSKYAHRRCVVKAKSGQATDQADLFGEDEVQSDATGEPSQALLDEIFEAVVPPPTIQSLGEMMGLAKKPRPAEGKEADLF
jgi:hypothetical protein